MLARALALEPDVLLLDEPTSALDEQAKQSVEQTLIDLREQVDVSYVLVTHELAQARRMADWVVRLAHGGRMVDEGSVRELIADDRRHGGATAGSSIHVTLAEVAATLVLVAVAVAVSIWQKADLERDIGIAVFRSFIQLTAIGFVITFIFDQDSLALVVVLIAAMVTFGAFTARSRARDVPTRLLAAGDRAGAGRADDARPGRRARHLQAGAALSGSRRRHGRRQRDDGVGRRAQPPGRRGARASRRGSRRRLRSGPPPRRRCCP